MVQSCQTASCSRENAQQKRALSFVPKHDEDRALLICMKRMCGQAGLWHAALFCWAADRQGKGGFTPGP